MIQIQQLKCKPDHTADDLEQKILRKLGLRNAKGVSWRILRQSVDAHRRPALSFVYTVEVSLPNEAAVLKRCKKKSNVTRSERKAYRLPLGHGPDGEQDPKRFRPVIVGTGPAGLFCAYLLAHANLRPVLLERGGPVEERAEEVERFWKSGLLNPDSNVQFGEGGAGAFSDGKLNSSIKDPEGRVRFVLETFASLGADPSICYSYKPHVGTDVLARVLKNMRTEIEALGGTYRFRSRMEGLERVETDQDSDPRILWRVRLKENGAETSLVTDTVVLAIGHSARDTCRMLYESGFSMTPKAFAVGLRAMHPQQWVNDAMYGADCPYALGAAPYKLTHRSQDGRGVYSFCMCPGGYVVNASSEPGMLAVNGMSYHDRAEENANSAIVVTVRPEDYRKEDDPLAGIAFQRQLEKAAYLAAGGALPLQRLEDYEQNRAGTLEGIVRPAVKGAYRAANLREVLPETLSRALLEGMHAFARQIPGFDHPDALLCGVESRTSSPVRILRGEQLQAEGFPGVYPCGEGAGYAGGITSAAVDGMKVAEAILGRLRS